MYERNSNILLTNPEGEFIVLCCTESQLLRQWGLSKKKGFILGDVSAGRWEVRTVSNLSLWPTGSGVFWGVKWMMYEGSENYYMFWGAYHTRKQGNLLKATTVMLKDSETKRLPLAKEGITWEPIKILTAMDWNSPTMFVFISL